MSPRPEPVRTCTGCGARKGKTEMIRIVADPSGRITPDLKGKLPARGAYTCFNRECIERAAAGRLSGALKIPSAVDGEELLESVGYALHRKVLSLIGLAQKGGSITSGTTLVEGELRRGTAEGWIALVAEDASRDIGDRIMGRLRAGGTRAVTILTKAELGDAIGKSPRSVLLVRDRGLGDAVMKTINRYRTVMNKGGKAG